MNIFLAPRSNETSYKNFLSTIESGVDYSIIEPHLDEQGKQLLASEDKIFAWGTKDSKKSSWEKLLPGDVVLFYKGREGEEREGKLVYAGRLLYKQNSKALGTSLWPPKTGEEPWTCIFFLNDLKPVYIPITDIADFAGYSRNLIVQGFMPINEDGVNAILAKFGDVDKFIKHYSADAPVSANDLEEEENHISAHSEAQLLLLKIGTLLGFDTFCPDKGAEAYGEKLIDYISLREVPKRFLGEDILKLVTQIDVIWFKDEVPVAAFEVEHSTKILSGMQRLCQLSPLSTRLYIVASTKDYHLYEKFINTDPYYKNKGSFRFRSYKQLESYFKSVSEFTAIRDVFME